MIDLARALARDPELLLLDEITAALPSDLAERVFAVMSERREHGRSVLFITHRLKEVIAICRAGVRSTTAAAILTGLGFEHVSNLKGGMLDWNDQNLAVER